MRNRLHRLYLGFVLSFILHERSEICDSPFIIINDIQTNLLLEHLVKERKMTLNITGAFPTERRQCYALSWKSTGLDCTI